MNPTYPADTANTPAHQEHGSAIVVVLMAVAVLCIVAGTLLSYTTSKQAAPFQATSWHEAGTAAEAGVEIALGALRRSLHDGDSAWGGWDTTAAQGGTTPFAKKFLTDEQLLSHGGEGNQTVRAVVEVSVPTGTGTVNPPEGGIAMNPAKHAYVVRSTGIANVPGPARVPLAKPDQALRKLNFLSDFRTKQKVQNGLPQVARVIEAIVTPVTPFAVAVHARQQLDIIKGQNMIVDSYNPAVITSSIGTNSNGYFSSIPVRSNNGTIATNGKKKDIIRLDNATVYGMAAKGGGSINMKGLSSISGEIIDGFYRELKPVPYPGTRQNPAFVPQTTASSPKAPPLDGADRPSKKKDYPKTVTITAGKGPENANGNKAQTLYYKLNNIHLHKDEVLKVVKNGNDGGIAEIWVTGDVVIHKGGRIEVEKGARAIFLCEKNVNLEEQDKDKPAVVNKAEKIAVASLTVPDPEGLQFYGVTPATRTKARKFKIKTNMIGVVYAPDHTIEVNLKKDAARAVWGSLVGRNIKMQGATQVHYDETLAAVGKPFDYTLDSWQEDWFDPAIRPIN